MMLKIILYFGKLGVNLSHKLHQSCSMLVGSLLKKPILQQHWPLLIQQLYNIGVTSLLVFILSGLFIGIVLGLQGYIILSSYGAESHLGVMITLSLFRELGPVITGLLFAGHIGSALTAEIGSMKTTEQLSSLEMMAVDPLTQVIAPRFWAGIIIMPLLTLIFITLGICGGAFIGINLKNIDDGFFWSSIQESINWHTDLLNCIIKSVIFSIVVTWIALFNGYDSVSTSEGIGRATTRTVIYSSIIILGLDALLTLLMFGNQ